MATYLFLFDIPVILFLIYDFLFLGTESTQIRFFGPQRMGVSTRANRRDAMGIMVSDLNMSVSQGRKGLHDRFVWVD